MTGFGYRVALAMVFMLLAGCVTSSTENQTTATFRAQDQAYQAILEWLPGEYGNYAQHWSEKNPAQQHWLLNLKPLLLEAEQAWFLAEQYPAAADLTAVASRSSRQVFHFSKASQGLLLRFSPLTANLAQPPSREQLQRLPYLPGCEVLLQAVSAGVAGQTAADGCKIPHGDHQRLLTKDFAFSPESIHIGEQLRNSDGGMEYQQIYRFNRRLGYQGWAGTRTDGQAWQLAKRFSLHDNGGQISLINAAGEEMGYRLRLARVPWLESQPQILRMDLIDEKTGEIMAYSWADAYAAQIGLNLDSIQVGLQRISGE